MATDTVNATFDLDAFRAKALGIRALLIQTDRWVDIKGKVHRIDEMSVRYKSNCLAYLRRRAAYLGHMYQWGEVFRLSQPSGWSQVHPGSGEPMRSMTVGEVAGLGDFGNMDAAFDEFMDDLTNRIKHDPEEWLDSTPLMTRLSNDVMNHVGGDDD